MTLVLMITQQPYTVAPRRSLSLAQCSTLAIASYHLHRLSRLGGYPLYRTLTSLLGKAAESVVSGLLSPRLSDLYATYGDLPSEHEESSSSDSDEDLDSHSGKQQERCHWSLVAQSLSYLRGLA